VGFYLRVELRRNAALQLGWKWPNLDIFLLRFSCFCARRYARMNAVW